LDDRERRCELVTIEIRRLSKDETKTVTTDAG
jgi:hypothetical protein